MAPAFENLFPIARGTETYYCIFEARQKLFSRTDGSTLMTWIKLLSIVVSPASEGEQEILERHFPRECQNPFLLISQGDLTRLLYCGYPRDPFPWLPTIPPDHHPSDASASWTVTSEHWRNDNLLPCTEFPQGCRSGEGWYRALGVPTDSLALPKEVSRDRHAHSASREISVDFASASDEGQILGQDAAGTNDPRAAKRRRDDAPASPTTPVAKDADRAEHVASACSLGASEPLCTTYTETRTGHVVSESVWAPHSSPEVARGQTETASFSQPSDSQNADEEVPKSTRVLKESEMSSELLSLMQQLKRFYSQDINFQREGGPLQESTLNKMVERISAFFWFAKRVKGIEPALSLCSDPSAVQDFIQFATEKRKIKAVTASRYISAFLNAVKFLNAQAGERSAVEESSMTQLRSLQRQLESQARKERLFKQAAKPLAERKIVYPEILELCRELKWQVQELTGLERARCAMDLCLLLMYCAANPGRVKEFVTLRLYAGQSTEECRDQNFICFGQDGSVVLLEGDYKTKYAYGPSRTDLTQLPFLTYYIELYRQKFRPQLLMGNAHDFFFVAKNGAPFSAASYAQYISALFEKHFSLRVTTNDLRKCVVDYFLSLPESGDLALRESIASVMKHSLRTQRRHYDERPMSEKKVRAISFLGDMTSRAICEDEVHVVSDEDDDGFVEVLPSNGELVALVAADSTISVPSVFVGKVLRYSEDHKTVFLADFQEVEPCKFKLNAGKSYRESAKSIVYPVDIVYLHASGVYELRTPKSDIHKQVKSR